MLILAPIDCRSENICILPVVIAELEFGNVQRHIFAAHFVECADHAALENRPETFNRLSVDGTDDILTSRMVNCHVWIILVERIVARILIGTKQADPVRHRFADEGGESVGIDIRDHASHNITLAADSADDWRFSGTYAAGSAAPAALIPMPVFGQAADESFIDLDDTSELINVLHESGSDLVAHEPRGFIRTEAHITIKLQSTHAFLARKHEMDYAEPLPQRLVRVLENRSGNMREAVVSSGRGAFVTQPIPLHCTMLLDFRVATPRAGYAFRPAASDEIGTTSIFVGESFFPLGDGHLMDWLGLFRADHIGSPYQTEANMTRSISQVKHIRPNKPGKRMTAIPEGALMDRREFIAATGSVAAAATASQTFTQTAAEERMMRPPHYKALEGARKTWRRLAGQNQLPKLIANVKFKDRIKASPPQARRAA
jgi:hypothetical protein